MDNESDVRHHRLDSDEDELTDSRFARGRAEPRRAERMDRMQEVELQDRDADTVSPSLLANHHDPDTHGPTIAQLPARSRAAPPLQQRDSGAFFCSRLNRQQRLVVSIVLAIVLFIILVFIIRAWYARDDGDSSNNRNSNNNTPSYPAATAADIERCIKANRIAYNPTQPGLGRSPLCTAHSGLCEYSGSEYPPFFSSPASGNLMISHATVLDGKGNTFPDFDINIKQGVIIEMGSGLPTPSASDDYTVIDVGGAFVTPGLVDMHSHIGVYPWPEGLSATDDGNEMTNPTYPQMRVIDAFDPEDWAIPSIMRMGITTSQVLPGSGNLMGGEGGVFKLRGHTIKEMFVENSPRILKMACGENPKRVYGSKGETPMSRMGNAWLFRSKLDQARRVLASQYDWCAANANNPSPSARFPYDMSVEGLVSLLRAEARLNVHCYEVHDLEMMLRLSREFNFTIAAFHHALEAYKVAPYLKERNITVATFSDLWGYKKEGYDGSTLAPSRLDAFGVPVAIKSDHPVIFAADLMYEAAKARHYGLSTNRALAAVTSVPAAAIGMADKIGSLAVGLDGDVVVWDRDPFTLGARPRHVAINGVLQHSNSASAPVMSGSSSTPPAATLSAPTNPPICPAGTDLGPQLLSSGYALTGVSILSVSASTGALTNLTNAVIVVDGSGSVSCMKAGYVDSTNPCAIPNGVPVFGLSGGWVIPGMIDAGSRVGQQEIGQEGSTHDGEISGSGSDGSSFPVQACDGIRLFGAPRHIRAAWAGGITSSIVRPMGSQLIQGTSCAYHTCYNCSGELSDPLYSLASELALHVTVGQDTKSGGGVVGSISGQLAALRSFLRPLVNTSSVIAEASSADAIGAVLRLQKALGFKLTIMGGAEAVVHKQALAAQGVGVLLSTRVPPSTLNTVHARWDAMAQLQAAGVSPLGMFVGDVDNGRNLRFEAGIAVEYGLPWKDALAAVTSQVAKIFGLTAPSAFTHTGELAEGTFANFVAFDDNPFSLQSRVQFIGLGNWANCQPRQL